MGACLSRSTEQAGQTLVMRKDDRSKGGGNGAAAMRVDRHAAGGELYPSATCNVADSADTHAKEYKRLASDPIHQGPQGATRVIGILADRVLSEKQGDAGNFKVVRRLGKGGFGVVWLCARTKPDEQRRIPQQFALKELTAPKPFPLGRNKDIRDYMPLSEAAIQRFLTHTAVVDTYWADVRCLHPVTLQPLDADPDDIAQHAEGSWLPLARASSVEHRFSRAMARLQPTKRIREVRLQMRIAMEYCDLGSVHDFLTEDAAKVPPATLKEKLQRQRKVRIAVGATLCALLAALDIAEALKFMHRSKTLHGDLKPQNILLTSGETGDGKGFKAKISDFGLSQHMAKGQQEVLVSKGTEAYLSPEVVETFTISEASDVYAMGLLMWELWHGIFWHAMWAKEKKKRGVSKLRLMADVQPSCSANCPPHLARLIADCVATDPEARPDCADIVNRLNDAIGACTAS